MRVPVHSGEYAPKLSGKLCPACGKETRLYYSGHKQKHWQEICGHCRYISEKQNHPDCNKGRAQRTKVYAWKKFNGTHINYQHLFQAQDGICAICGKEETVKHTKTGKVLSLAYDHDHLTGKPRGLLCNRCNLLLGRLEEEPGLLEQMLQYQQMYKAC